VGKVNVGEEEDLAIRYRISGIPALLLFKSGKIVQKWVGAPPETVLVRALGEAA
jgi:thioredoxin 1